jgi:exo-beta-1,3-glucanase (GH17 family)
MTADAGRAARRMMRFSLTLVAVTLSLAGCAGTTRAPASGHSDAPKRETPFVVRAFEPRLDGRWIGNAIAYGPHRDGQSPDGAQPTREELLEDLRIIARHWSLIRVYGSLGPAEDMLALIRAERLPLRIMLGVWLAPEDRRDSTGRVLETFPEVREANRAQVLGAIRLARTHEDQVIAISAGNETQVFWSAHRFPAGQLVRDIRALRAGVRQPVTTADDFNFWNKPESREVAREVDFITMHYHPLWNGRMLADALDSTVATYRSIQALHPDRTVVIGETGWATQRHDQGEQALLMKGEAGEAEQRVFYEAMTAWARENGTPTFFFEAFDENWKGGAHPDEVEKHWGLFHADRRPKAAMRERD